MSHQVSASKSRKAVDREQEYAPSMMQLPSQIRLVVQDECPRMLQLPSQEGLVDDEQEDGPSRLQLQVKKGLSMMSKKMVPAG